jgi:hypothetical protein
VGRDRHTRSSIGVGVGRDISYVGTIGFLRIITGFEIAARRVVGFHATRGHPRKTRVRWDRRVGLVQLAVNRRLAGKGVGLGAVREVVNVFRAGDVDEFQ